jgi:hypothetical protein
MYTIVPELDELGIFLLRFALHCAALWVLSKPAASKQLQLSNETGRR